MSISKQLFFQPADQRGPEMGAYIQSCPGQTYRHRRLAAENHLPFVSSRSRFEIQIIHHLQHSSDEMIPVAAMFLTTEAVVTDKPEPKPEPTGAMPDVSPAGMPGMEMM